MHANVGLLLFFTAYSSFVVTPGFEGYGAN